MSKLPRLFTSATTLIAFAAATLLFISACCFAAPAASADDVETTAAQDASLKELVENELIPALHSGDLEQVKAIAMRSARSYPFLQQSPFIQAASVLQPSSPQTSMTASSSSGSAPTSSTSISSITPILFALITLALLLQYAKVLRAQG